MCCLWQRFVLILATFRVDFDNVLCCLWQRFVLIFATFRVLYDMVVVDSCKLYEGLIAFLAYLRSAFSFLRSAFSFFFKALRSCLLRVTSSSLSISIVLNWN